MTPFAEALETTEDWLPHKIKLLVVAGFRLRAIKSRRRRNVDPRSKVYINGLPCLYVSRVTMIQRELSTGASERLPPPAACAPRSPPAAGMLPCASRN